ncbi:hypothetical protein CEXT_629651 [Caerostris extrusa]|uniref:Uncharacterized protein n=1 Tax=Caerostris extrusa TaxID=172846 RepID=A0AAV4VV49_CAEEX|nr:hypothetical protein CEXT_629651 [Caerostris extrusa]
MDYEDCHENLSDAEPDSDHEDMDDAQKLLGTWLGELENLKLHITILFHNKKTKQNSPCSQIDLRRLSFYIKISLFHTNEKTHRFRLSRAQHKNPIPVCFKRSWRSVTFPDCVSTATHIFQSSLLLSVFRD